MQMISIFDQTIALTMQLTSDDKSDGEDKSVWYIPVCSIYLRKHLTFLIYICICTYIDIDISCEERRGARGNNEKERVKKCVLKKLIKGEDNCLV
jgi:hypothetical protein